MQSFSAFIVQANISAPGEPEIAVEQPAGTDLADGSASIDFGVVTLGAAGVVKTFTIRNAGTADLTGLALTRDGAHAADFTAGALGATTLAPGAHTTFTVTFAPGTSGERLAAIHLANLFNFAFGMNPNSAWNGALSYSGNVITPGMIVCVRHDGAPTAEFVRRGDFASAGLTCSTQFSGDLVSWETVTSALSVLADDGTHQVVGLGFPLLTGGTQAQFFRLLVGLGP